METIISILVGFLGVPVVNLLKRKLGWQDEAAMLLTVGVSVVLGVFALWVAGTITGASFQRAHLNETIGTVLSAALVAYRLIVKPNQPEGA